MAKLKIETVRHLIYYSYANLASCPASPKAGPAYRPIFPQLSAENAADFRRL
ncbi:hypothetical protein SAMN03080598_01976 [Algoriphagus boritolerans DSM 17298 = JCM 18970]|uniref:Uncharacterized protein n=1 Tax=Algoriphagus boritolerans DSM 17298 = JCM 18970 TaxID=1120964 RepID=A0A1H5W8V5_9BACT|nr:hypothetical protein SAMN03080598_01976 [Algoriphagus boritolerans DSM 17298 = JCM 18970]